jgi:hypothetical protein
MPRRAGSFDLERVLALADIHRLRLKAQSFGVLGEHPVEIARPQPCLVAAGAALDLDDHVLLVVRVALDHRQADLLFQLLDPLMGPVQFLAHLGVLAVLGQEFFGPGRVILSVAPLHGQLGGGLELAVGTTDLGIALAVGDHLGVGQLLTELGEAALDLRNQVLDHAGQSRCLLSDDLDAH